MKVNKEYKNREYTNTLIEMVECGDISAIRLAHDLMCWMSEDDVKEFALKNDYLEEEDE